MLPETSQGTEPGPRGTTAPERPSLVVHKRVRRLARRARQGTQARALCSGLAALLVTLALVIDRGRGLGDVEGLGLALAMGLLTTLSWILAVPTGAGPVARRLDAELGLDGALLAAFEGAAGPRRPLCELGASRVVRLESWARASAIAVPHSAGFLALPLVGAAVLLGAVERADLRGRVEGLAEQQVRAVAAGIQGALAEHGGELQGAARDQVEAALAAARAALEEPGAAAGAMGDASEALERAAEELPAGSPAAQALRELALGAEVLGMGDEPTGDAEAGQVGEPARASAGAEATGEDTGAGSDVAQVAAGAGADDGAADGGSTGQDLGGPSGAGVAPGDGDGGDGEGALVAGADAAPPPPRQPDRTEPGAAVGAEPVDSARATASARWWSARDDALVRRWRARDAVPER